MSRLLSLQMSIQLNGFNLDRLPIDWDAIKPIPDAEKQIGQLFNQKQQMKELMQTEIYQAQNKAVPDELLERDAAAGNLPIQ